jgi:hypothetical protein
MPTTVIAEAPLKRFPSLAIRGIWVFVIGHKRDVTRQRGVHPTVGARIDKGGLGCATIVIVMTCNAPSLLHMLVRQLHQCGAEVRGLFAIVTF